MKPIIENIREEIGKMPEGALVNAKCFLHAGSRAAIDQALKRLNERGELWRIYQGNYVRPVETKYGTRAPAIEKLIAQIVQSTAQVVAPNGAAEANALGLTTQFPVRMVYLTPGKARKLNLGSQVVEMKHAQNWLFPQAAGRVGSVVRALNWLGEKEAAHALAKLKGELKPSEKKGLAEIRPTLPSWMAKSIGEALGPHG